MSDENQAASTNLDEQTAELVRQGVDALKSGNTLVARALLSEVTRIAPGYQDAWLWLSDLAESDAEREVNLRRAIEIDPHSPSGQIARRKLDQLLAESEVLPPPPTETLRPQTGRIADADVVDEPEPEPKWWQQLTPIQMGLIGLSTLAFLLLCGILGMNLFGTFFGRGQPTPPPAPIISVSATEIVVRLQQNGAEAADARPAVPEDFGGLTPRCLDNSQRFYTPSLGFPAGGIVLVCPSANEAQLAKAEFDALGVRDPERRSWTYLNNNVFLQVDGRLPPEASVRYEQVIAALSGGTIPPVVPPATSPPSQAVATPLPFSAFDVYNRIAATSVDVANPRPAVPEDFGAIQARCLENSVRYFIPSLGDPAGGIMVVCTSAAEAEALKADYDRQSAANPTAASWRFINNNIFVQADGRMSAEQANKFAEVVAALSTGQAVAPLPPTPPPPPPDATPIPISAFDVFNRVAAAGVEVTDPRGAVPEDFGAIQARCLENSVRYFTPSLGFPAGGVIVTCPNAGEAQALKADYDRQSAANPGAASWTFINNNVFAQADGRMPQNQARKFQEVIASLSTGAPVQPLPPTAVPPTATQPVEEITVIPLPPTDTPAPPPTDGPIPPTDTPAPPPTDVPLPPTDVPLPPTDVPIPPTDVPPPTDTALPTIVIPLPATATPTITPTATLPYPLPGELPAPSPRTNAAPFPGSLNNVAIKEE